MNLLRQKQSLRKPSNEGIMITTWNTSNAGSATDRIVLPLTNATVNCTVWYQNKVLKVISTYTDNTIIFPDGAGIKKVIFTGDCGSWKFYMPNLIQVLELIIC